MTSATPYHHGDLPRVLRAAAAEVLAERGVAGFSLREVARRAGVSHAAPAHHFGDATGLLTAVAVEGFRYLTEATRAAAASSDDPLDSLVAVGRAYVSVALDHPGHVAVAFRWDIVDVEDPEYQDWGNQAFSVLEGAIERLAAERNPDLDVGLASALCWAMVEGLLVVHAPLSAMTDRKGGGPVPPIPDLAEALTRLIVRGLAP